MASGGGVTYAVRLDVAPYRVRARGTRVWYPVTAYAGDREWLYWLRADGGSYAGAERPY